MVDGIVQTETVPTGKLSLYVPPLNDIEGKCGKSLKLAMVIYAFLLKTENSMGVPGAGLQPFLWDL